MLPAGKGIFKNKKVSKKSVKKPAKFLSGKQGSKKYPGTRSGIK